MSIVNYRGTFTEEKTVDVHVPNWAVIDSLFDVFEIGHLRGGYACEENGRTVVKIEGEDCYGIKETKTFDNVTPKQIKLMNLITELKNCYYRAKDDLSNEGYY